MSMVDGRNAREDGKPKQRVHRNLVWAIKVIVTVAVCAWITWSLNWTEVWRAFGEIRYWPIIAVIGLRFLGVFLSAVKWRTLLAIHDIHYPLRQLCRWYFISYFLSQFLPSIIGGDAYRIAKTFRNVRSRSCAVLAIFVERVTGLAALLVLGWLGAVICYAERGDDVSAVLAMAGTIIVGCSIVTFYVMLRFELIGRVTRQRWCPHHVVNLVEHARDYRRHPRQTLVAILISFAFQFSRIGAFWLLVLALGAYSHVAAVAVAGAGTTVVGLLPISLGGLGVMEGSFMHIMAYYGLDKEMGLATMLLSRLLLLLPVGSGALLYLLGGRERVGDAVADAAQTPEPNVSVS